MRKVAMVFGLAIGFLVVSGSALAHHGRGVAFDDAHMQTHTGTVTQVIWTNPHAFIFFDVKGDDGKVTNWGVEWTNPRSLIRLGLDPGMFKIGTTITMEISPAKSGAPRAEIIQCWDANHKLIYDGRAGYKGVVDDLFQDDTVGKKK